MTLQDAKIRDVALDPGRSFLVRAPAGSGKTTVLIHRLLRLLSLVDNPEEIVAVTFTRKAAQEMRNRVTDALLMAKAEVCPLESFKKKTYELATFALANDERRGWNLIYYSSRLRILTIDALCQSIVRQMPIMSGMAGLTTMEDATSRLRLYRQASRFACEEIVETKMKPIIVRALNYFDNDWAKLESLIAEMLPKRDQWLTFVSKSQERSVFKKVYSELVSSKLAAISSQLDEDTKLEIVELVKYAASNCEISQLSHITHFPGQKLEDLAWWHTMLELFLTKAGALRKSATATIGFPVKHPLGAEEMKLRWGSVVSTLSVCTNSLSEIPRLPTEVYTDAEWTTTKALVEILRLAAAHLMVLSDNLGQTDFTSFSMAALDALGAPESPTDLALGLDYQINHLLIDEFQDTSITQFELVRRLIAGWTEGEQKSIFLVGDPMQSIYRFRQSEVSLFKQVSDAGFMGDVKIEALALSVNFRSQGALVDWINKTIPVVIEGTGQNTEFFGVQKASRVASSEPFAFYPFPSKKEAGEAEQVIKIILEIRRKKIDDSVAILVRSRAHLNAITASLVVAKINVSARELEPLESQPVIKDLMSLSKALNHLGDRMAWLAVLRAPWGGLSLGTLHKLSDIAPTFLSALDLAVKQKLIEGEQGERVARLCNIFNSAIEHSMEMSLSQVVQKSWLALGGPAIFYSDQSLADARKFFVIITGLESERVIFTADRLRSAVKDSFSEGNRSAGSGAIEVMTMHKAKGLEFDHVIIPSLGFGVKSGNKPLLRWHQSYGKANFSSVLIAPIGVSNLENELYDYLHHVDAEENKAEMARLLYVVLTRARTKVYLLGHAKKGKKGWAPQAGSLLSLLWPVLSIFFEELRGNSESSELDLSQGTLNKCHHSVLRALPSSLPEEDQYFKTSPLYATESLEFDWASNTAKHVGTVVHRLLELVSKNSLGTSFAELRRPVKQFSANELKSLGVDREELESAISTVLKAIEKSLSSKRGLWIFSEHHETAESELALSHKNKDGLLENVVIDRTFVDNNGIRWIIDYKTGSHSGGGLSDYLDSEERRYKPKLNHYAEVMLKIHFEPIKLGLYFPLLDAWREWDYIGQA